MPDTKKTGKNVAIGAAGLIFWPAWFFFDFSDAEKMEIQAYRNRYNHLVYIFIMTNNVGLKAISDKLLKCLIS